MKNLTSRAVSAFTMLELVVVIVVIGILSALIVPRMADSRIREGMDQVVSHIRYTQHLAMMDDKFNPNNNNWHKGRWQILFELNDKKELVYTIFSDSATYDGIPQENEIARNPQDTSKLLTGMVRGTVTKELITSDLNLGQKYGFIGNNVLEFKDCVAGAPNAIVFDNLGRPMHTNISAAASAYAADMLITNPSCKMVLKNDSGETMNITIQRETGFAEVEQKPLF